LGVRILGSHSVTRTLLEWAALVAVAALSAQVPTVAADPRDDEAAARAVVRDGARSLEAGEVERAIRQFERALRLHPDDPEAYLYLSRAHGIAGRFKEAHRVLAKAEIHAHDSRKLRYTIELQRGDLHRDAGERQQAREAYERAAGLRIFNREARRRLKALDEQKEDPPPE
jgi:tetratricopeptide (TPR) repeat protein